MSFKLHERSTIDNTISCAAMEPTKSVDLEKLSLNERFDACLYVVEVKPKELHSFVNARTTDGMRCAIYCVAPNPDIPMQEWVEFEKLVTSRKSGKSQDFPHGFRMDELSTYARFTDGIKHKVKRSPYVPPEITLSPYGEAQRRSTGNYIRTELGPNGEEIVDAPSHWPSEHGNPSPKYPVSRRRSVSISAANRTDDYVNTENDEFAYENDQSQSLSRCNSISNFNSKNNARKSCLRKDVDAISMHSLRFDDSFDDKEPRARPRSIRSAHISNGFRKDRTSVLTFEGVFERPFNLQNPEELSFNGERKQCYFNELLTDTYGDILVCVPDSVPLLKRLQGGDSMHIRGRKWYTFFEKKTLFVDDPHGFILIASP